MTDERKNEIWVMLPQDFKEWICCKAELLQRTHSKDRYQLGEESLLEDIFGKDISTLANNLTAQAEEKPKVVVAENVPTIDYQQYRLELAKEIAVAVIRSNRWDFESCNPVEQANNIVKRLKETEI